MNIYEFAEEFRLSMRLARKLEKRGILNLDSGESEHGAEIRRQLSHGQPLTVSQILRIIENPSILRELGRYRCKAENELAALGDVLGEAAPREVAAHITDAAFYGEESIGVI